MKTLLENGGEVNRRMDLTTRYGRTCLHQSILSKNIPIIKLLLQYGEDPNAMLREGDQVGWFPVHLAVRNRSTVILRLLSKYKVDLNLCIKSGEYKGYSALHLAVLRKDQAMVETLIQLGAVMDLPFPQDSLYRGWTAAQVARYKGYSYLLALLSA